ncbi:MAG: AMP-binding protein [Planctomycetes bacterium]|nr:AMP-binding protein [Planctomycetota bacterium]
MQLWSPTFASRPAVFIPDGPEVTYGQLQDQIEAVTDVLRAGGVRPGDPIGIVLGNNLEFLVAFLATTRARAVAAPLNPGYKSEEFRFYLEDAGAKAVIVPPGDHPAREAARQLQIPIWECGLDVHGQVFVRPTSGHSALSTQHSALDAPTPTDVALFLHTSGTTSRPKGVPLTHGNLMASIANIAATYQLTPRDRSLIVMPLFHVHGLIGATLSTLHTGGAVVVPPKFSAGTFWQVAAKYDVTWYSAVPTIHQILLGRAEQDNAPRRGLRFIRSCSSALAPAVFHQLEERFGAPVLEAYGMTEAAHQMASNPLPPGPRKPGFVGPGTGVGIAILDEQGQLLPIGTQGEVSIRGANVMHGYLNNAEANASSFCNGYFRTGDQGVLDENGYLMLTGRLKELINRGGEKISPLEVDAVLLEHPAVAEAVSFAAPDAKYGEEVHAAVVLKATATPTEIQAFCGQRLADFKVPKVIHVAKEVPRTATGKIQRRHVAAHFLKTK